MSKLETLVTDIYKLLTDKLPPSEELRAVLEDFGEKVAETVYHRITRTQRSDTIRMSNLGTHCKRKLWYTVNMPEKAEPLSGRALLNFMYGDVLEHVMALLTKLSGHTIEGEQDELEINGIVGHRDAIVDGVLVDFKSASPSGMGKFLNHQLLGDDPFGYYDQINAYLAASHDDPRLQDHEGAAFIAFNKVNGQIVVDYYPKSDKDYSAEIDDIRAAMAQPEPPPRGFADIEDGRSGNRKLGLNCSYCAFKKECWPGLKAYKYAREGKRYLTVVTRLPDVTEVEVDGEL